MGLVSFDKVIILDEIDSTNTYLKDNLDKYASGSVIIADKQTNGRGRFDRKWEGEEKKNIFASFLIKEILNPLDAVRLTFLFSLGVEKLLEKYISKEKITLKWPNDLLIGSKKICGILSEYKKSCAIVGIGINVLDFNKSEEIKSICTTIEEVSDKEIDFEVIRKEFIEAVNEVILEYKDTSFDKFPSIWLDKAGIKDKRVSVKNVNEVIEGVVKGIDSTGMLILELDDKREVEISSGDIFYDD